MGSLQIPFLNSSKCVLLMGDEGLSVYTATAGRATHYETVGWDVPEFEAAVADLIRNRCGGRPVIILNDMVEQHYRKERVPNVGVLDRANVLQRRLNAAFPSYPMSAALKLKERAPAGRGASGPAGSLYLFAAVPALDAVSKTLSAVSKSHATLQGLCLLPVESASMVHALSKKLDRLSDGGDSWTVFIGQHKNGSLRQIVTRNGELALTRMTPIADSDHDLDGWATDVAGEVRGTMGYLSRFGYDPSDGLDLVIIADDQAGEILRNKIDFDCTLTIMDTAQAGRLIGLKVGPQADPRYADYLHVAWVGKKFALAMALQSSRIKEVALPAKVALAASVALFALCGYFVYQSVQETNRLQDFNRQLAAARQNLAATQTDYQTELDRQKEAGVDFALIDGSTKLYEQLAYRVMKPLPMLDAIGRALGPDLHLQSIDIKPLAANAGSSSGGRSRTQDEEQSVDIHQFQEPQQYIVTLRMLFPGTLAPEIGVQQVNNLHQRLRESLPDHTVEVLKQVADLSYTGNFVGESTSVDSLSRETPTTYEAEIQIRGTLL